MRETTFIGGGRTVRTVSPGELLAEWSRGVEPPAATRPAGGPRFRYVRRLPRKLAVLGAITMLIVGATGALALVPDGTSSLPGAQCDIQVADKAGTAICTTDAGAKVRYIGDSNTTFGSSGTGNFNPFVRIQGSPTEAGYNTSGAIEFDTKTGTWTHAIKVSDIPIRTVDGCTNCWELFVDINDGNSGKQIRLNELEIYFSSGANNSGANVTGYPFTTPNPVGTTTTKVYDFSGAILINDVNQGSGRGDLRYMIPTANMGIPANCNVGNASCSTYFVLYSQWGAASGSFASDGGFEEWKVKTYPGSSTTTQVKRTSDNTSIADGASVPVGTSVYDTATLSGTGIASAGGTVTYFYAATPTTCATGTQIGSPVTVTNGVAPNSSAVPLTSAGTYEFWAVYSGDANILGSTSTCGSETVVVISTDTTTTTHVKNTNGTVDTTDDTDIADGAHVNIGTVAYDTATLTGTNIATAGGTVTYYVEKGDTSCTIAGATSLGAKTVLAGVVPASDNYTFASSGTYEFWAVYGGDGNNNGSTSTCLTETVIVNADTATTTQVKNTLGTASLLDDTDILDGGTVAIGTVVYDTATLTGNTSDAGGTVTYYVEKGDASCTIAGATSLGAKTVLAGVVPISNTFTFTSAGTYEFWAVYGGDTNNNGSTSACLTETVVAGPNTNGISTAQSLVPNDSATLTNLTSDAAGTITFKLFPPSNATCSTAQGATAPVVNQTINVSGGTSTYTTTNSTAVTAEGTYRWQVVYTGDANNSGATSACGVEIFTIDNDTTSP